MSEQEMQSSDEGFIAAEPDVRLYFRAMGEGNAVVIPLVSWSEEYEVLSKGRRVIFYDPRNRGQSTAVPLERISFQNDVRDLDAVRKYFDLERIAVIGWSYYAGVVARYAMEYPEAVERFVMVCGPPMRQLPYRDSINRLLQERLDAVAPGFLQSLRETPTPEPEQFRRFWDLMRQVRSGKPHRPMRGNPSQYDNERPEKVAAVFTRAQQTQGDWDWREEVRRLTCPALFVVGSADILPLAAAQEWAEGLPHGQLLQLDGVGHFPSLEDPDRFFPALDRFLSD